jgi:hypothetical protein
VPLASTTVESNHYESNKEDVFRFRLHRSRISISATSLQVFDRVQYLRICLWSSFVPSTIETVCDSVPTNSIHKLHLRLSTTQYLQTNDTLLLVGKMLDSISKRCAQVQNSYLTGTCRFWLSVV